MANQVTVNKNNGIQVVIEPPANVQVEISRAVIGTVANVESANTAKTVTNNAQPNITSVGTLTSLAISGDLTTVDSITLDTAASEAYATAKMYWNTVDGTMNVGLYNGVIQQIGQEVHFYGKAQGNITNGQVVMFAGVQGDHILMSPANTSAPGFKKEWIIGIATQNITNGSFGYVTWFGKVNDVSTNGFPAGAILWFNPSVVGGLTNVEPTGNSIKVLMASVIKAETSPTANNGIYLVRPTFEPNINDIQGVKVQTPLQGQVMTYDAANSVWINANVVANVSNVAYAANAGYANAAGVAYSVSASNISGIINLANYATVANSVAGANVTGTVASATNANHANVSDVANSVAAANVVGVVANANYATYSGTSYSVSGSNVTGEVANANFATTAQTAYSVDGANVSGDVSGANHANVSDVANSVSGANVVGEVANAAYATSAGSALVASSANSVAGANVSGEVANAAYATNAGSTTIADSANSVAGANVSGDVAGANHANIADVANSVTAANVSGLGNIATINLDGNASSVLLGNGYWGALPSTENANYANFAGTAYSVDGANVNGEVANATYATSAGSANSIAGANVSGEVANANYASYAGNATVADSANSVTAANVSGLGNIATLNITGNTEQWLRGDGTWNAIPAVTSVANANYSNFAGTAYSVDGANVVGDVSGANHANVADTANSVAGANVSGEVANATYATSAGSATVADSANSVAGANVSGEVANANYATFAGSATVADSANSVALANVSGVGNIASLNLDGSASNVLYGNGSWAPAISGASGSNTQIQFNDNGAFAGSANLTWDKSSNILTVGGNISMPAGNIARPMNGNSIFTVKGADANNVSVNAGGLLVAAGQMGNNAVRISNTTANINMAPLTLWAGNAWTDDITGKNILGGGLFIRAGAITANIANSITHSGLQANSGTITYKTANTISAGGVRIDGSAVNTGGNDYSVTSNINLGTQYYTFGSANISHSNGNIANIRTTFVNIGHDYGIGVRLFANISNVVVGNITPVDNLYFRTTGVGEGPTTNNVNNVQIGNVTTADMNIETGQFKKPSGSNVSNVTVGNLTTGGIFLRTGAPNDLSAVTGTFKRGNIELVANAFVLDADASNLYGGGNKFTFYNNGTATLSNLVVANYFEGNGFNLTDVNAVYADIANSVQLANVDGIGNIAELNLDGSSSNVLYGNGVWAPSTGGTGSPGGSNTQLQYNNSGSFGGISTVTYDGANLSLGPVANVKMTGGSNNEVLRTDGTGNLSFTSIALNLLVGTRSGPSTVPITNYTFEVETRSSGNVTVYVN